MNMMFPLTWMALIGVLASLELIRGARGNSAMDRLMEYVGNRTNPLSIPLPEDVGPLSVNITMVISNIFRLDEVYQTLTSGLWFVLKNSLLYFLQQHWTDYRLTWNPAEYGNISLISVPLQKVWKPDVEMFITADDNPMLYSATYGDVTMCQLRSNGTVEWLPHRRVSSTCAVDVYFYPFDSQSCGLHIYSPTLPAIFLNWTVASPIDATRGSNLSSREWEVISLDHSTYNSKDAAVSIIIELKINIRRNFSFFSLAILLPSALLAVLTLAMFWIPPNSTDKMSMGMAIWTCLCVILLVLVGIVPGGGGRIPLVGSFFILNLVLVTATMIVMIGTTTMAENCTPVPRWLSKSEPLDYKYMRF
ncbi:neuronal acetylcholine receptor subunit alpha-2-like [Lingula anatina]|uniref:Neuronal acetylcholine receptor subunit alpha-2-like n=1 Tax=Lingula anatina TaxID=7574 RepID=A0A1S3HZG1_LINAN|nr:neuronal acetylcholine receptor subunit alpha-2-like [Lingula anatina]|eukprot:XP_013391402.1 neuronal acetylcholine receptor subunit alpha-2-like [Lingula anatina]